MAVWLILQMDHGVIRREATRRAAVAWMTGFDGGRVLFRHCYAPGSYEYHVGRDDDATGYFVEREDRASAVGWWGLELPDAYPFPDRPYAQDPEVDRDALIQQLARRTTVQTDSV